MREAQEPPRQSPLPPDAARKRARLAAADHANVAGNRLIQRVEWAYLFALAA